MRKIPLLTLVLSLMAGLLVGCDSSNVKISWSELSSSRQKNVSYASFNGMEQKTFRAKAGQAISLDCDVTVEKGSLLIKVVDPSGIVLWEETFRENTADTVTVIAPRNGFHTIRIKGQETGGSFDISWSIGE